MSATDAKPTSTYDKENVFAQILAGKAEATKVFENRHVIAILDQNPVLCGWI